VLTGPLAPTDAPTDIASAVAHLLAPHQQPANGNITAVTAGARRFLSYEIGGRFAGSLRGGTVQPVAAYPRICADVDVAHLAAIVTPDGVWQGRLLHAESGFMLRPNQWPFVVSDRIVVQQRSAAPGYAVIVDCVQ
jgi:hypothetical protein